MQASYRLQREVSQLVDFGAVGLVLLVTERFQPVDSQLVQLIEVVLPLIAADQIGVQVRIGDGTAYSMGT